jgi:hypothetical protein
MGTATFQSRLLQGRGPVKVGLSPDSIPLRWLLKKFASKRVALNMIGIALLGCSNVPEGHLIAARFAELAEQALEAVDSRHD